jgi:hypothetical protein
MVSRRTELDMKQQLLISSLPKLPNNDVPVGYPKDSQHKLSIVIRRKRRVATMIMMLFGPC